MKPIFDIEKIRKNRAHARENIAGHDFLFVRAADRLIDNLRDIQRDFQNILIIGERGSGVMVDHFRGKNITIYDVTDGGDEIPEYDAGQFDCIVALPYLHVVNDVPGFLAAMKYYLKPDGLFLCAFFGGQSLQELRECITQAELKISDGASRHIHPMIDHYQFAVLLQRGNFALPVVDYDRVVVEYSDLQNLYDDLHNMGEGNAILTRNKNIGNLKYIIENNYKNEFFNSGFECTFDIVFGVGWQAHESQQKPAKRGSGQVSLTEIL